MKLVLLTTHVIMSRYAFSSWIAAAVQADHRGAQHHHKNAAHDQPAIQVNMTVMSLGLMHEKLEDVCGTNR